jgi:arylsulfatase A-like enzyme
VVAKYRKKHAPGESTRDKCHICQNAGLDGDALNHWAGDHNPHLAAMLESIDDGVGAILGKLQQLGLSDNTIVVFTSDNGGETNVTSNAPLRGGSRHHVRTLEIFGSAADDTWDAGRSDLDFLVDFLPMEPGPHSRAYFDFWFALRDLFQRQIDLVETPAVTNPYFLKIVNQQRQLLYTA